MVLLIISLSKKVLICLWSIILDAPRHVAVMPLVGGGKWSHMWTQSHWEERENSTWHYEFAFDMVCDLNMSWAPFEFYQVSVLWVHLKKKDLFIFWLLWIFIAAPGLSLLTASQGWPSSWCKDFSLRVVCCWGAWFLKHRFSSYGIYLLCLWHVGSSWTKDWTHVPFIDRQILKH